MDYKKEVPEVTESRYIYLPRIGESRVFNIKAIGKVKGGNPKYNFAKTERVVLDDGTTATKTTDLGYKVEALLEDGKILSISNLSAFRNTFAKHEIQDGDKVEISHPEKGKWEVKKI